jgi:hypothetical protein
VVSSARNEDFRIGEMVRERKSLEEKSIEVVGVVLSERRDEVVRRLFRCPCMDSARVEGAIGEDERRLREEKG